MRACLSLSDSASKKATSYHRYEKNSDTSLYIAIALNYHCLASSCVAGTPVLQRATGRQDPVRRQRRRARASEAAAAAASTARQRGTVLQRPHRGGETGAEGVRRAAETRGARTGTREPAGQAPRRRMPRV